ncbi:MULTISPECIES: DNA gyrase/topoisomerase IV subunit A [unclassified Coleofasciculus]|uniref:DNA gyrase/topoisomerase IV subunit A n=1 Tax=unclassified Coleofasciculus TaxID=2692782 RepID=UPI00187E8219|nr:MULTISPECIES: DNA topoisomerase (ATP-hydrolyzing) [unclassified Coleofasciculus]MBE9129877.1 DNA topoisomerase 4 subunit A [Coleofasciculus sp. LEGE 07081]MBE9152331.1 DNA topoisomerase 4 subunit A [Coleofasciculus sp. LEGE 07092]
MAKQLNLLGTGQVISTALHAEMQQSYLEYAMSVIVGRALPDVRDGLKPVHRRILYAMHELGLTPDRPYRKCARVVGDVLGKYHPHGDQSVYDALVRLVQDFSTRYPLLDGHGNFGSVDNDPPAAMRYTETRLSAIGNESLLSEIGEATVDFIGNFDSSQQEPIVLPAQLPILLLNGCSGIAVGMATNIPPHNLGEMVDALISLIDHPDLADEKLWELVPGPDFPTGGEIIETSGIRDAYSTGRGSIPVRGVAKVEQIQVGRSRRHMRTAVVITELPYQVNKAAWIEKVADLVNQGRLEGIADLRDESDRRGMRVVVELKRDAHPRSVLKHLYQQTALQSNFGVIMLALVDGQPRQLSLRQLLEEFLKFREETLTRQYTYELNQKEGRRHIVEGLLVSIAQLDATIEILRHAPDGTTAKTSLQSQLNISDVQADAILSMPLRRLTGLERQKLQTECDELTAQIQELQQLLSSRHELLKALKKDLRSLKRKYTNRRRTKIRSLPPEKAEPDSPKSKEKKSRRAKEQGRKTVPPLPTQLELTTAAAETVLEFTYQGRVQRQRPKPQRKSTPSVENGDDFVVQTQLTTTQAEFVAIASGGKAYPVKVQDIPPVAGRMKGASLASLLPEAAQSETVVTHFRLPDISPDLMLILLTQQGRIKRLPASELSSLTARGLTLIKLKDSDRLQSLNFAKTGEQLLLATSNGRILRFEINDQQLPLMGRTAQGNQALRLRRRERLVGCCAAFSEDENLLLVSEQGYGKRLPMNAIRLGNRGDLGTQALQFKTSADTLVGMIKASPGLQTALVTSAERVLLLKVDTVKLWWKDGCGDRLVKLQPEEKIVDITTLEKADSVR